MIRCATAADAADLAGVEMRAFRHAYADVLDPQFLAGIDLDDRIGAWERALADDGQQLWAAAIGDRVVGYAIVRGTTLRALYVDPAAQGAGVGTRLLAEAETAGARELEVFEANGHGRHFYEARGWRDAGPAGEWLDKPLRRYVR